MQIRLGRGEDPPRSRTAREAEQQRAGTGAEPTLREAFGGVASRQDFATHFKGTAERARGYRFFVPTGRLEPSGSPQELHWKRTRADDRTLPPKSGDEFVVELSSSAPDGLLPSGVKRATVVVVRGPPEGSMTASLGGVRHVRRTTGALLGRIKVVP